MSTEENRMFDKVVKKAKKIVRAAAVIVSRAAAPERRKSRTSSHRPPLFVKEMTGRGKKKEQIDEFLRSVAEWERSYASVNSRKRARRMMLALHRERERVMSEWAFAGNGVLEQIKVDVEARVTATEAEVHKIIAHLVEMGAKNVDHTYTLSSAEEHSLMFSCSALDLRVISSEMHDRMTASFYPIRNCG
jgi:hypothetical protein